MVRRKKIIVRQKDIKELPSKWFDIRAILPATIIALLWSAFTAFIWQGYNVSRLLLVHLLSLYPPMPNTFMYFGYQIFIFILEWVVVSVILYFIFWIILREHDKKLYMKYKAEKVIR